MTTIEKLLKGSIDMHCHHGPDTLHERSVDALQAARQAQAAGMRAIVLKSHVYPTAPLAYLINQFVPDFTTVGALSLDSYMGGLNPHAVEASAKLGAKVVWMPTFDSSNDARIKGNPEAGIAFSDKNGKLLPVIDDILDIIKKYNMVLATGHVSVAESFALVDKARGKGISKIVITHPQLAVMGACLNIEQQKQMAEKGAFLEFAFFTISPAYHAVFGRRDEPSAIVEAVRAVGAEHSIISTDHGQALNPVPVEAMRVGIAMMLAYGLTEKEIETMVKVNPAKLLDLN